MAHGDSELAEHIYFTRTGDVFIQCNFHTLLCFSESVQIE